MYLKPDVDSTFVISRQSPWSKRRRLRVSRPRFIPGLWTSRSRSKLLSYNSIQGVPKKLRQIFLAITLVNMDRFGNMEHCFWTSLSLYLTLMTS